MLPKYFKETWKFWNPKNHKFSKNQPKIEFRCTYQFKSSSFWKYMLQIPKSKTKLFGTFSKIESKIRKISQLQSAVKIVLLDGFWWNQVQMKGLGVNFQDILNFDFHQFFNVLYLFEHAPDPDFWKSRKIVKMLWFQN